MESNEDGENAPLADSEAEDPLENDDNTADDAPTLDKREYPVRSLESNVIAIIGSESPREQRRPKGTSYNNRRNVRMHRCPSPAVSKDRELHQLPLLRDVENDEDRTELVVKKLHQACTMFDFVYDSLSDLEWKDIKRSALTEVLHYLSDDDEEGPFETRLYRELFNAFEVNTFRVLPPCSARTNPNIYEPEDEEPMLEPSWPHLQIVYEAFLRFLDSDRLQVEAAGKLMNESFVKQILYLFDSEDPRERDCLKVVLHRIYGRFVRLRTFIRKQLNNIFSSCVHEGSRHNGITELLEVVSSIVSGFLIPLKDEHTTFLFRVLIPLHKCKSLATIHSQLSHCVLQFCEKDISLTEHTIRALLKCWPNHNAPRSHEIMFLNELEEILDVTEPYEFSKVVHVLFRKLSECVSSVHFQVAERALYLWNNDYVMRLVKDHVGIVTPIMFESLYTNCKCEHWNRTVHGLVYNAMKQLMDMDQRLFDNCVNNYNRFVDHNTSRRLDRDEAWKRIQERARNMLELGKRLVAKRERIGALLYRDGPSSHEDEDFFLQQAGTESDAPKGINCNLSMQEMNKDVALKELAGSETLIVYFAEIGCSQNERFIDLDNIETLIKSGANVNFQDAHGQSLMHEVALRWPSELADMLLSHGADIDHADSMGRTPLHVAASVNAPDIVKWLVKNGANIHGRTYGEEQSAIHYAAKNNAVEAISALLDLGAKLSDRDYKERTPLLLAAETGREDAARVLLDHGSPAGVFNDTGSPCLTYMIETMPDVAATALEQFYHKDNASKTAYYHLAYLENQIWENPRKKLKQTILNPDALEPLEQIIRCNEERLIMHPVVQRLINKKREVYGNRKFYAQLFVNFVFTMIWTILSASLPQASHTTDGQDMSAAFYRDVNSIWTYPRMVLEVLGLSMALYFVVAIKMDSERMTEVFRARKIVQKNYLMRDIQYCHPRFPQELNFVRHRITCIDDEQQGSFHDAWYFLDIATMLGLVAVSVTRVLCVMVSGSGDYLAAHRIIYVVTLIVVWLRFMKSFRPFIALGPFIAMLGFVVMDTLKFAYLFFTFYIPYVCALWVVFGMDAGENWISFRRVCYEVFRMTVVDSFNYGDITAVNKFAAQLISGTYLALVSITCFNLYIALLSETFSTILGNATATAFMLQGEALISSEQKMSSVDRNKLRNFIEATCSPEIVREEGTAGDDDGGEALREIKSELNSLRRNVEKVKKNQSCLKKTVMSVTQHASEMLKMQKELDDITSDGLKE